MGDVYMKRLNDLEYPLDENSPVFLDPRPNNNKQENGVKNDNKGLPAPLTKEEKDKLR